MAGNWTRNDEKVSIPNSALESSGTMEKAFSDLFASQFHMHTKRKWDLKINTLFFSVEDVEMSNYITALFDVLRIICQFQNLHFKD